MVMAALLSRFAVVVLCYPLRGIEFGTGEDDTI